jgi:GT2 family glycosyltransferase
LHQTLACLQAQNAQPAEVLVVDASDVFRQCRDFAPDFLGRLQHQAAGQRGAASQRNEGFLKSSQPYVLFLDDDMRPAADCLRRMWEAIQAGPDTGGVGALVVNECYHPPGRFSRWLFAWLNRGRSDSYAGRCLGPGITTLPEDRKDLPPVVPVDWLPTGMVLYRREALPSPPFDDIFRDASLCEDLALSLRVGRRWRLLNARTAQVFHDESEIRERPDWSRLSEMDVVNHHYIHRQILGQRDWLSELQFWVVHLVLLPATLFQESGLRRYPQLLWGRIKALIKIMFAPSATWSL